jgi:hypothetical protein
MDFLLIDPEGFFDVSQAFGVLAAGTLNDVPG